MIPSDPAVWQVSGGPIDRPYGEVFLRHGVALIGPGEDGPWRSGQAKPGPQGFLRRFAEELRDGDILLLRTAVNTIAAVGVVVGDYEYLQPFDDVNGWDLRHARRVRWFRLPEPYQFERAVFGATPTRCSRVQNESALDYARRFVGSGVTHWQQAPLPKLPTAEAVLDEVPERLRDVVGLVQDLAVLYGDPERLGDPPAESEMIAHFVVPFLLALGWPPENIAVEWRRIDVAVFDSLPRTPESCRCVIEAKRLGTGLDGARKQAEDYVATLCVLRDVVVTDGFRYRAFACEQGFAPVAYANLDRLKQPAVALFDRLRRT